MGPIETGIRPPEKRGRPCSPVAAQMQAMEVDQSFTLENQNELMVAKGWQCKLRPKKFSVCKVPREGWRVWRLE